MHKNTFIIYRDFLKFRIKLFKHEGKKAFSYNNGYIYYLQRFATDQVSNLYEKYGAF